MPQLNEHTGSTTSNTKSGVKQAPARLLHATYFYRCSFPNKI